MIRFLSEEKRGQGLPNLVISTFITFCSKSIYPIVEHVKYDYFSFSYSLPIFSLLFYALVVQYLIFEFFGLLKVDVT